MKRLSHGHEDSPMNPRVGNTGRLLNRRIRRYEAGSFELIRADLFLHVSRMQGRMLKAFPFVSNYHFPSI